MESESQQVKETSEEDSISQYMEHLLGRSRNDSTVAKGSSRPAETRPVGNTAERDAAIQVAQTTPSEISQTAGESLPTTDYLPPVHWQDKDATRASLNSLREQANLSACSAIATHASKELRDKVLLKSLLMIVAFTVVGVMLTSKVWGSTSYHATGWAAAVVGLIMAGELARLRLLTHRKKSVEEPKNRGTNSGEPGQNSSETSELV